jgi:hypothetical protein
MSKLPEAVDLFWDIAVEQGTADPRLASCYKCKYRTKNPGTAHSCCSFGGPSNIVYAVTGLPEADTPLGKIGLLGADPHGIANGWFTWPIDFDPTWLWWCMFYEETG